MKSTTNEGTATNAARARRGFWLATVLVLFVVALGGLGTCFYGPPAWFRTIEQTRLFPDDRRLAIVMLSSLRMQPRGLAAFPDGGIPITLRQVSDVWVCDPQGSFARRVARIPRPKWARAAFTVWMIDWQSNGKRSSLYLRVSGENGNSSDTRTRVVQHVRVDFDRDTADHSTLVYLDSPWAPGGPLGGFVNPPGEYGIMDVRRQGDTLSVWTDRSPDWRTRFRIDRAKGTVSVLAPVPRRYGPKPDTALADYADVCPGNIRGVPSPTESRISFGPAGEPPVVTAAITRLDVSCTASRHPNVGSEKDGEIEFVIGVSAWIDYEIKDPERFEKGGSYGAEVIFEALSASSAVLGSTSMGFIPYSGTPAASLNCGIEGMKQEDVARVARVVARWQYPKRTR